LVSVGLKGDIAIGVNLNSVDTWIAPHLFNLDKSTGAPPDYFSKDKKENSNDRK
jgi:4-alpha-glucanotransferase